MIIKFFFYLILFLLIIMVECVKIAQIDADNQVYSKYMPKSVHQTSLTAPYKQISGRKIQYADPSII